VYNTATVIVPMLSTFTSRAAHLYYKYIITIPAYRYFHTHTLSCALWYVPLSAYTAASFPHSTQKSRGTNRIWFCWGGGEIAGIFQGRLLDAPPEQPGRGRGGERGPQLRATAPRVTSTPLQARTESSATRQHSKKDGGREDPQSFSRFTALTYFGFFCCLLFFFSSEKIDKIHFSFVF